MSHAALLALLSLSPAEIRRRQPFAGPPSFVDWSLDAARSGQFGIYHLGHLAGDCGPSDAAPADGDEDRFRAMRAAARWLAGIGPAPAWASDRQMRRLGETLRQEGAAPLELTQRSLGGGVTAYVARRR